MTYIAAWKDKSNIYVTGDSLITTTITGNYTSEEINQMLQRKRLTTSFGEVTTSYENVTERINRLGEKEIVREKTINQETTIKIHNIKNKIAVGYAGQVKNATDIITHIDENINNDLTNLKEVIEEGGLMYGYIDVHMVFGYIKDNSPMLMTYINGAIELRDDIVLLGSISSNPAMVCMTKSVIELLNSSPKNSTPSKKLIQFCSCIQVLIIRANFIKQGVGGFYTGAYLNSKGFHWKKDSVYISFSMNSNLPNQNTDDPNQLFTNSKLICLFHREDKALLVFMEPINGRWSYGMRVFNQYKTSTFLSSQEYLEETSSWEDKHRHEIMKKIEKFDLDYFTFFCIDVDAPNKMSFIHNKCNAQKLLFDIKWVNGVPELFISGSLVEEINPLDIEFLHQFHWLSKDTLYWHLRTRIINFLHFILRPFFKKKINLHQRTRQPRQ